MSNNSGSSILQYKDRWETIQNRIREIYEAAGKWVICTGECQIIILMQYGRRVENIDEDNLSNIVKWFGINGFRAFQLLSSEYHNILMSTDNDYSIWFNNHDKYTQAQPHYSD